MWKGPSRWHLSGLQLSRLHCLPAEGIYKQYFLRAITPLIYCSFSIFLQHQQICRKYHACGPRTTPVRERHKNSQAVCTHKAEISRKSNRHTRLLEKKIHWQITPAFRLTSSHLLIWLTLSVTFPEIPGNLIPTHGAKATWTRLTFLMFCNLIGWLFPYFLVTSPSNLRGRSGKDSQ